MTLTVVWIYIYFLIWHAKMHEFYRWQLYDNKYSFLSFVPR